MPIFEIPRILASVFAWWPFLDLLGFFLLYPGFTKSAQSRPHRPCPVLVNARGPKEILLLAMGYLGEPKDIFGACKSSEDL